MDDDTFALLFAIFILVTTFVVVIAGFWVFYTPEYSEYDPTFLADPVGERTVTTTYTETQYEYPSFGTRIFAGLGIIFIYFFILAIIIGIAVWYKSKSGYNSRTY